MNFPFCSRSSRRSDFFFAGVMMTAAAAVTAASPARGQTVTIPTRAAFLAAAPGATNTINFERGYGPAQSGPGFVGTFTELGYVTFLAGANYKQEIADGFNLGQGNNDVYLSQVTNPALPTADVTFGVGVLALGFDFKNTANGLAGSAGMVPQSFTFNLFSGATSLGSFASSTLPDGSTFQFIGFTSNVPITELTISATVPGLSPNLDIVLDNFAVASPVPEPGTMATVGLGLLGLLAGRRALRSGARRQP